MSIPVQGNNNIGQTAEVASQSEVKEADYKATIATQNATIEKLKKDLKAENSSDLRCEKWVDPAGNDQNRAWGSPPEGSNFDQEDLTRILMSIIFFIRGTLTS